METETFLLFLACLLFSGFSFYWNTKTREHWLEIITIVFGVVGLVASAYILINSFI